MASQENLNELATKPIGRLLWDYSLPGVVGMLVMALYNVVDRIFIGQVVGPEAIAGLAVTFPLMNITTAIGVLVGVGSSSWVSILLGQRDFQRAHLMLGNAMTLTLINAAIYIAVFAVWMSPILRAFGAGDVTLPYARTYMLWVLPGLLLKHRIRVQQHHASLGLSRQGYVYHAHRGGDQYSPRRALRSRLRLGDGGGSGRHKHSYGRIRAIRDVALLPPRRNITVPRWHIPAAMGRDNTNHIRRGGTLPD